MFKFINNYIRKLIINSDIYKELHIKYYNVKQNYDIVYTNNNINVSIAKELKLEVDRLKDKLKLKNEEIIEYISDVDNLENDIVNLQEHIMYIKNKDNDCEYTNFATLNVLKSIESKNRDHLGVFLSEHNLSIIKDILQKLEFDILNMTATSDITLDELHYRSGALNVIRELIRNINLMKKNYLLRIAKDTEITFNPLTGETNEN